MEGVGEDEEEEGFLLPCWGAFNGVVLGLFDDLEVKGVEPEGRGGDGKEEVD